MSGVRLDDAVQAIGDAVQRLAVQSFVDVGCGRGELLDLAGSLGVPKVCGTEIVDDLLTDRVVRGWAHDLPFADNAYDLVSCCDVVEHLIPDDTERVLVELRRVANKAVYVTANNKRSVNKSGHELHINRRPYDEWDQIIRQAFDGWAVTWLKSSYVSEGWLCENTDIR